MPVRPSIQDLGTPTVLQPVSQPRDPYVNPAVGGSPSSTPARISQSLESIVGNVQGLVSGAIEKKKRKAQDLVTSEVLGDEFDSAVEAFNADLEASIARGEELEASQKVGSFFAKLSESGLAISDPNLRLHALRLYGEKVAREQATALRIAAQDPSLLDFQNGNGEGALRAEEFLTQAQQVIEGNQLIASSPTALAAARASFETAAEEFRVRVGQTQNALSRELVQEELISGIVRGDTTQGRLGLSVLNSTTDDFELNRAVSDIQTYLSEEVIPSGRRAGEVLAEALDGEVRRLLSMGLVDEAESLFHVATQRLKVPGGPLLADLRAGDSGTAITDLRNVLESEKLRQSALERQERSDGQALLESNLKGVAITAAAEATAAGQPTGPAVDRAIAEALENPEGRLADALSRFSDNEVVGIVSDAKAVGRDVTSDTTTRDDANVLSNLQRVIAQGGSTEAELLKLAQAITNPVTYRTALAAISGMGARHEALANAPAARSANTVLDEIRGLADELSPSDRDKFVGEAEDAVNRSSADFLSRGALDSPEQGEQEIAEFFNGTIAALQEIRAAARGAAVQTAEIEREILQLALDDPGSARDLLFARGHLLPTASLRSLSSLIGESQRAASATSVTAQNLASNFARRLAADAFETDAEFNQNIGAVEAAVRGSITRQQRELRAQGLSTQEIDGQIFDITAQATREVSETLGVDVTETLTDALGRAQAGVESAVSESIRGNGLELSDSISQLFAAVLGREPAGLLQESVIGLREAHAGGGTDLPSLNENSLLSLREFGYVADSDAGVAVSARALAAGGGMSLEDLFRGGLITEGGLYGRARIDGIFEALVASGDPGADAALDASGSSATFTFPGGVIVERVGPVNPLNSAIRLTTPIPDDFTSDGIFALGELDLARGPWDIATVVNLRFEFKISGAEIDAKLRTALGLSDDAGPNDIVDALNTARELGKTLLEKN